MAQQGRQAHGDLAIFGFQDRYAAGAANGRGVDFAAEGFDRLRQRRVDGDDAASHAQGRSGLAGPGGGRWVGQEILHQVASAGRSNTPASKARTSAAARDSGADCSNGS